MNAGRLAETTNMRALTRLFAKREVRRYDGPTKYHFVRRDPSIASDGAPGGRTMTRFLMAGLALVMMAAGSGCVNTCRQCNNCKPGLFGHHGGHGGHGDACRNGLCNRNGGGGGGNGGGAGAGGYGGPGGASVAYPYYTVRAPRDFLSPNPRGIGP